MADAFDCSAAAARIFSMRDLTGSSLMGAEMAAADLPDAGLPPAPLGALDPFEPALAPVFERLALAPPDLAPFTPPLPLA